VEWERSPYRLRLEIPYLPPMNTAATRRHLAVQSIAAGELKALVAALVGRRRPFPPLSCARLVCIRHSSVMADRVNVALSFKPIVDGLVLHGVLRNDSPKVLIEERYEWSAAPPGLGFCELLLEEVLDAVEVEEAGELDGDLRESEGAREGQGPVPAGVGREGVRPRGPQGQIPLSAQVAARRWRFGA